GSEARNWPTATTRSTGRGPQDPRSGPTTSNPIGPASSAIVITPVITLGRSASGVRIVKTPISGAFTSGPKIAPTNSTAITAAAGNGRPSSGIGTVNATSETAPSRIGSNFGTSLTARIAPRSEPAPNAAKKRPAIFELSLYSSKASTGSDAESI